MPLIELEGVSKSFRLRRGAGMLLGRGGLSDLVHARRRETFEALHGITFTVEPGESVGIIGANGSGKSTLLKILAGVTTPTTGRVVVRGRVASLLELGAGFHPLLTGRENVYLNGRILGMTRADVNRVFDQIVAFSGIEEFIDNPVETYSSGMYVRLGFAVAVHANPDIFLVDEVLSVGDEEFQRKCRERIGELREQGKTILFVSHDLSIVNTLCRRVILLTQGRMITRATAQQTIDFYLRQIGRRKGIHTIAAGGVEAIASHGRLSVFFDGKEISAPSGYQVHIRSMGNVHSSTSADWEVIERGESKCVAVGRMPRLPIVQRWELQAFSEGLRWTVSLEVEKAVSVQGIDVNLFTPACYTRWVYADEWGEFPEILPRHHEFAVIAPPDTEVREVAAIPADDWSLPPVVVRVEGAPTSYRMQWANTDYLMGCRVLQAGGEYPEDKALFESGVYPLMTLELDLSKSREQARALTDKYARDRTLRAGPLSVRFQNGNIRLFWEDRELTKCVNVYTSMLIHNLWNDSQNLHWGPVMREGMRAWATGRSRRFPFAQHWEIGVTEGRIDIAIQLEVTEPLEVQEYHTSIGLAAEYTTWQTDHETGEFPEFDPGLEDWRHLNSNYAPGRRIKALSTKQPSVILDCTAREAPFRMTALNTGPSDRARVLQALRTSREGRLRFESGRHLYFEGSIRIEDRLGKG